MVYRMFQVMVLWENVQTGHSWEGLRVVTRLLHLFPSPASTSKAARLPGPGPFLPCPLLPHPGPFTPGHRLQAHRRGKVMCCCTGSGRRSADEGKVLGTRCWHHGCTPIARCRERSREVKRGRESFSQQVQQPELVSPMRVRALQAEAWRTLRVLREAHPHLFSLNI